MAEFYIESNILAHVLERSPEAAARGLLNGLTDVKNDWQAESVDIAPIKDNALRESIKAKVFSESNGPGVEITAKATRGSRQFNYAYYIHEDAGHAVTGEKKFLDKPAQENKEKWAEWIEKELENELRRAGW